MAKCQKCECYLPDGKTNRKRTCKSCQYEKKKIWRKTYFEKNREQIRKQVHLNYLKNKEKVLKKTKNWRKENKEKYLESLYKSESNHPLKKPARKIFNYHIEKGTIKKPEECSKCLKKCKPEGHHIDYAKPLEVIWLCRQCHAYEHRVFKV